MLDFFYLIDEGVVNIIDNTQRFVIAKLSRGSFFGDYNLLFNVKSNFEYRVGPKSELQKSESNTMFNDSNISTYRTQFFVISKQDFIHITDDFPEYTIFLRERAILRRAHFMKI